VCVYCAHMCVSVYVSVSMCVCVHACACVCACVYVCVCAHMFLACKFVCVVWLCVHACVRVFACMLMCACVSHLFNDQVEGILIYKLFVIVLVIVFNHLRLFVNLCIICIFYLYIYATYATILYVILGACASAHVSLYLCVHIVCVCLCRHTLCTELFVKCTIIEKYCSIPI